MRATFNLLQYSNNLTKSFSFCGYEITSGACLKSLWKVLIESGCDWPKAWRILSYLFIVQILAKSLGIVILGIERLMLSIVGIALFSEPLMLKFPNELSRFSISVWLSWFSSNPQPQYLSFFLITIILFEDHYNFKIFFINTIHTIIKIGKWNFATQKDDWCHLNYKFCKVL